MLRPRAIFVDLDGTLADSVGVMRSAYTGFLTGHNAHPTDSEFESLNGPPLALVVRQLKATHLLPEDETELLRHYSDLLEQYYDQVAPSTGAADLLRHARRNNSKVGVVTSNSAERAQRWLSATGLLQFVDFVVSGDDVKSGKPNPEPYLLAAERASCPASESIAVEDSRQGAQSAIAAGLKTFVVTCKLDVTWPREAIAVASLTKLADLLWLAPRQ